jgi:Mor family transcriptional regulator
MGKTGSENMIIKIGEEVTRLMVERGHDQQAALTFGFKIAEMVSKRFGGRVIYVSAMKWNTKGCNTPLAKIAEGATQLAEGMGNNKKTAEAIGQAVKEVLIKRFKGADLYIPRSHHFFIAKRNEEMLAKYDGSYSSLKDVALEYGMTARNFHSIIKAAMKKRQERAAQKQADAANGAGEAKR